MPTYTRRVNSRTSVGIIDASQINAIYAELEQQTAYAVKTADYTIAAMTGTGAGQSGDGTVAFDCSSGAKTATLPDAVAFGAGRKLTIPKLDVSANALNLATVSGQTIDRKTSTAIYGQVSVTLKSSGGNWIVESGKQHVNPTALDLTWFGAVFDGTTDNAAAMTAARTAATVLKVPVTAPGGICAFTGQHIFPDGVGLIGCGSAATIFKGLNSSANLRLNGSRTRYAGFSVDGNHIADTGIAFGVSNGIVVSNVHATNCVNRGIWLSNVQNGTFTNMQSSANDGSGVVIDNGTGACIFFYCGGTDNKKHQLWITASDTEAESNPNPFYLQFFGGVWERGVTYDSGTATGGSGTTLVDSTSTWATDELKFAWVTMDPGGANQEGQPISGNTGTTITVGRTWSVSPGAGTTYRIHFPHIRIDACAGSIMRRTVIASGASADGQYPIIDMKRRGLTETVAQMAFDFVAVSGVQAYHIGLDAEGVSVGPAFDNKTIFGGFKIGINLVGSSAQIENEFPIMSTNVTTKYVGLTSRMNRLHYYVPEQGIYLAAADVVGFTSVVGDAGMRFRRKANGDLEWMDGTSFSPDTVLQRVAANVLSLGANDGLRMGKFTTGGRPTAVSMAQGTQIYDTTLSKPIWSDGTVWRDAAGTAV